MVMVVSLAKPELWNVIMTISYVMAEVSAQLSVSWFQFLSIVILLQSTSMHFNPLALLVKDLTTLVAALLS